MKYPNYIEDAEVIRKILKHPGPWDVKERSPLKTKALLLTAHTDHSDSQLPPCEDYLYRDPDPND